MTVTSNARASRLRLTGEREKELYEETTKYAWVGHLVRGKGGCEERVAEFMAGR